LNAQTFAKRAYTENAASTGTARSIEYEVMARVTHRMKSAAEAGPQAFPKLVEALSDNQRLWTVLALDVADEENGLPKDLRARIFYLAEFVRVHTGKVLSKQARLGPLLEINTAILRGLRTNGAQK